MIYRRLFAAILLVVMVGTMIVALLRGNYHYRVAYRAFQTQQWSLALTEYRQAAQWEPLNAKYRQMSAEALINLGEYDQAVLEYQRALRLKRDFPPYYAQLGWLSWLAGDLDQATLYFRQVVALDPMEAWRSGAHSELALALYAQGQTEEAIAFLKQAVALNPEIVQSFDWIRIRKPDGKYDVVIDPVYRLEGAVLSESDHEINKRILAHLGKAHYTARLFTVPDSDFLDRKTLLSLNQVLDAVKADYQIADEEGQLEASGLLNAAAQAAHMAGLYGRAEEEYLSFCQRYPESWVGLRSLGTLYLDQGKAGDAQRMAEQAIALQPDDFLSWKLMAQALLAQGQVVRARQAFDQAARIDSFSSQTYSAQIVSLQAFEPERAMDVLQKSLFVKDSTANRLALAALYQAQGKHQLASEQCRLAAGALLLNWTPPLSEEIWNVAVCLEKDTVQIDDVLNDGLYVQDPLIEKILTGHYYRSRGAFEQAIVGYQQAAQIRVDSGAPHFFLAETYQAFGQADKAEAEYLQAFFLDPYEALPLLSLGQLQWAQNRHEEAIQTLQAAVAANPGWSEAHLAHGNALLFMGDQEKARASFAAIQSLEPSVLQATIVYDFCAQLVSASIQSPGPEYVKAALVTIQGSRKRSLFSHPASSIGYTTELKANSKLSFSIATLPESWVQAGDGVTFSVEIVKDQGTQQVFWEYIDPKLNPEERRWHFYEVDLSPYQGQKVTIMFNTDAGAAGDNRYDWAVWGEPLLTTP